MPKQVFSPEMCTCGKQEVILSVELIAFTAQPL